jgi:hypothetical protein
MANAEFTPPDDEGKLLARIGEGGHYETRITWSQPRDRGPMLRVRLWVDEGQGFFPKRGIGFDVPAFRMADFARAVAEGLDLAIEHQKMIAAYPHRSFDARRR